jgi:hypothetical protein
LRSIASRSSRSWIATLRSSVASAEAAPGSWSTTSRRREPPAPCPTGPAERALRRARPATRWRMPSAATSSCCDQLVAKRGLHNSSTSRRRRRGVHELARET